MADSSKQKTPNAAALEASSFERVRFNVGDLVEVNDRGRELNSPEEFFANLPGIVIAVVPHHGTWRNAPRVVTVHHGGIERMAWDEEYLIKLGEGES